MDLDHQISERYYYRKLRQVIHKGTFSRRRAGQIVEPLRWRRTVSGQSETDHVGNEARGQRGGIFDPFWRGNGRLGRRGDAGRTEEGR